MHFRIFSIRSFTATSLPFLSLHFHSLSFIASLASSAALIGESAVSPERRAASSCSHSFSDNFSLASSYAFLHWFLTELISGTAVASEELRTRPNQQHCNGHFLQKSVSPVVAVWLILGSLMRSVQPTGSRLDLGLGKALDWFRASNGSEIGSGGDADGRAPVGAGRVLS